MYQSLLDLRVYPSCPTCHLDLSKSDTADGPAVLLIFILGSLLVPMALAVDHYFSPPLWAHMILWGIIGMGLTLSMLKPAKAHIIYLQYKHRPWDTNA